MVEMSDGLTTGLESDALSSPYPAARRWRHSRPTRVPTAHETDPAWGERAHGGHGMLHKFDDILTFKHGMHIVAMTP